jgi:transposase
MQTTPVFERKIAALTEENLSLKSRIAWFEKQLFGQKSEKHVVENSLQSELNLGPIAETLPQTSTPKKVEGYERGKAKKQRPESCVTDTGLRFGDEVPLQVIDLTPKELEGPESDQYETINIRSTYKLAKRPASYVVLEYRTPIIRKQSTGELHTTPMPEQVLEGSIAYVSLIAGLLIDKFLYHLPLHRQHQQLSHAGIQVARSSLTNWTQRAIELLRPIVEAQLTHVLKSRVLAMDETPIKSGRKHKGKMN